MIVSFSQLFSIPEGTSNEELASRSDLRLLIDLELVKYSKHSLKSTYWGSTRCFKFEKQADEARILIPAIVTLVPPRNNVCNFKAPF